MVISLRSIFACSSTVDCSLVIVISSICRLFVLSLSCHSTHSAITHYGSADLQTHSPQQSQRVPLPLSTMGDLVPITTTSGVLMVPDRAQQLVDYEKRLKEVRSLAQRRRCRCFLAFWKRALRYLEIETRATDSLRSMYAAYRCICSSEGHRRESARRCSAPVLPPGPPPTPLPPIPLHPPNTTRPPNSRRSSTRSRRRCRRASTTSAAAARARAAGTSTTTGRCAAGAPLLARSRGCAWTLEPGPTL